jgi:hypothetical protein
MKRFPLLLMLAIGQMLYAQNNLDILTLSGRSAFPTGYDSVHSGKARESGSFIGLTVPVPLSEKTIIYNSLNYFYFHVNNEPVLADSLADPINLHGFILRTGIIQRFSNGRSLQLLLSPRWMSDMKGGGLDNVQMGGLVMYEKIFSDKLTMGFGAMYNQECYGPYFVPLVNLNWQLSERLSIAGMLPVYAKIKYKAGDKLTVGISHFGLATTFNLNDPAYKGDYIERQSIDLSLFANYNISGNIYLEGRFGQAAGRSYKQYAGDQKIKFGLPLTTFGDERVKKNIGFENGLFLDFRLIYSIPLKKQSN